MKSPFKKVATVVLPETFLSKFRHRRTWRWFHGDYVSWVEARADSEGYDDAAVLARVLAATRKVRDGMASWERDGWTFDAPEVNEPLVSALKSIANEQEGHLDVIDFGGSLGSTWWQNGRVLEEMTAVRWRVVEQQHYVAAGCEFANEVLTFYGTLDEAQLKGSSSVILFSSILPYIEKPYELLAEMSRRGFSHVILDRTPFVMSGPERLVVQRTPPELGGGSYPSWLFDRDRVVAALGPEFELRAEWIGTDFIDRQVEYKGLYFQRIDSKHSI